MGRFSYVAVAAAVCLLATAVRVLFFLLLILVKSKERKPEGNPRFLRKVTSCFCCEVHQRSGLSKEHQWSSRQKMTFFL